MNSLSSPLPGAALAVADFDVDLDRESSASTGTRQADVHIHLAGVPGLLTLRCDPDANGMGPMIRSTLGLDLPARLSFTASSQARLRWLSPDEFLFSCPLTALADVSARLAQSATAGLACSDVSGGFALLELSGPAARTVLAKSTSLDVHPRVFPPSRTASTIFAKATATISHLDTGKYELIVRRSFARYMAGWLSEAAREHGLRVTTAR